MGVIKIERYFVNEYLNSGFFSFYKPLEIARKLSLDVGNTRRQLEEMVNNGILIKHPFKIAYNLSKKYYQKTYVQEDTTKTRDNVA